VIGGGDEHLSDLALERWLAGELSGGATGSIGQHLSRCVSCQARHRHRSDAQSAFARRPDLRALAEATHRRVATAPRPSSYRLGPRRLGALGALAALAAGVVLVGRGSAPSDGRAKGGLALELFVRHPDGTVASMLPDGVVAPGDRLRFRVGTARGGYLGIVSIDGADSVTGYLPSTGPLPAVEAGTHLLDGAIELDGVLGRERLFAFLCPEPGDTATMVARVRSAFEAAGRDPARLASEPALLSCAFTSFGFRKVPRP
jgi:hypothetical protein